MEATLQQLNKLSKILVQTPGRPGDLKSVLRHIVQTAQEAFKADACFILVYNPITGKFRDSYAVIENLQVKHEFYGDEPKRESLTQKVLREGEAIIDDLDAVPNYHNRFTRKAGIHAVAGLALRTRHRRRSLGVIYLDYLHQRDFSASERDSFGIFAVQASFLLQEAWLVHNLEEVARIGQEVNQNLDSVDELFRVMRTYVNTVLDESHTLLLAVRLLQSDNLDLYMQKHGSFTRSEASNEGVYHYIIETKKPLFIKCLSKQAKRLSFQIGKVTNAPEMESFIFVPLQLRDQCLGVLSIQHPSPQAYGREDLFILQLLADYIALALHNMRLYNNLIQLNEIGKLLTQHLEPEQTLQATADKIREATQADIVILYPYEPTHHQFLLPPITSGKLNSSIAKAMNPHRSNDIATVALEHMEPIFAKQSPTLYRSFPQNVHYQQDNFQHREKVRSAVVVPLMVVNQKVGVLFVNFRQQQRFDASQRLFITGLAHYAAIAIKNAQTFGTLSLRREHELQIITRAEHELNRTLELEPILNILLKLANEQVHAEEAAIMLYNPQKHTLEVTTALGRYAEAKKNHVISMQDNKYLTRWVIENRQPVRIDNVHLDQRWRELYIPTGTDILSELDVPLLEGEEALGVLNFESMRDSAFSQEDENFLLTLAGHTVLAIRKAQAYEREKRLAAEGQSLNEISKEISSQFDHKRVFDLIIKKTLQLTRCELGALLLFDPGRGDLEIAAQEGLDEDKHKIRIGLDQGIVGKVATSKRLLNIGDVSHPHWSHIYLGLFSDTRSELAVPMLAGDELRGVINVESTTLHHFNESDERLLKGLADLAVVALQNAKNYKQALTEAQRFELLYRVGQELSTITDQSQLAQAYNIILRIAEEHGQGQVVIRRYIEDTQELEMILASPSLQPLLYDKTKLYEGVNGQVAREKRTIVLDDTRHPPHGVAQPHLLNPATRSLIITPILFENRYYGNLGLSHEEVGHFHSADRIFYEGLARQLANTIYRLEVVQARQDFEQRALAAEAITSVGEIAVGLTHRLDNDLGLVEAYVDDTQQELAKLGITNELMLEKLENIGLAVRKVLDMSEALKGALTQSVEAMSDERASVSPRDLLVEAKIDVSSLLPPSVCINLVIENDVAQVRVIPRLVIDILHNLISNAVQAMPSGGKITLKAHNMGRYVALDVSDSGVGIPLPNQSKIFSLFYTTKHSLGFGLWNARRNAAKNGGDLKVLESQPGKGSTFRLLLPKS